MTFAKTKSPLSFVTTGADRVPRASLISVTVAPGITPPCASLTVPETVPVLTCADAGRGERPRHRHHRDDDGLHAQLLDHRVLRLSVRQAPSTGYLATGRLGERPSMAAREGVSTGIRGLVRPPYTLVMVAGGKP